MERLGTDRSTEITHFPHMRKLRRGRNERGEFGRLLWEEKFRFMDLYYMCGSRNEMGSPRNFVI